MLREGVATEAAITLVKETYEEVRMRRGSLCKYGWIVFYRYHDRQGVAHSGDSGYLSRSEVAELRVGDVCVICYDGDGSVWIGPRDGDRK